MSLYIIKLDTHNYLAPGRDSRGALKTTDDIEKARTYKKLNIAHTCANSLRLVPWWNHAYVAERVRVSAEFGGGWFDEEYPEMKEKRRKHHEKVRLA